jgi:chromosome partitioning protein
MRTIAVVARKGGSGKTTLAVHLGIAAHLAGRRTRILDTDPQQSASEVFRMRRTDGPECLASTPVGQLTAQLNARAAGVEALLIDTPAGTEEGMSNAIVLADLALLVIRPTFLDLAAAVHTADVLKRLRKPSLVVMNQAPVARDGLEPPAVRKAREALRVMRLPVVPVILRARASYQTTLESGASAVETAADGPGARELAEIWDYIERFAFPTRPGLRDVRANPHAFAAE